VGIDESDAATVELKVTGPLTKLGLGFRVNEVVVVAADGLEPGLGPILLRIPILTGPPAYDIPIAAAILGDKYLDTVGNAAPAPIAGLPDLST